MTTNEELIEELEDAKSKVYSAYQKHFDQLEQMREQYPIGFERIYADIEKRITQERDDIIEALDLLIADYQKKE